MKLTEIFTESDGNNQLLKAKRALETGKILTVDNASSSPGRIAMGDLKRMGFIKKHRKETISRFQDEEWWEVISDINFKIENDDHIYRLGDTTRPVLIDRR